MKKGFSLFICIMAVFCFMGFNLSANAQGTVRISFVFDGPSPANNYFLDKFKVSIKKSMKDSNVLFPKELIYTADWTEKGVAQKCNQALSSNATTVVALGYLSSKYMTSLKNKRKMSYFYTL